MLPSTTNCEQIGRLLGQLTQPAGKLIDVRCGRRIAGLFWRISSIRLSWLFWRISSIRLVGAVLAHWKTFDSIACDIIRPQGS